MPTDLEVYDLINSCTATWAEVKECFALSEEELRAAWDRIARTQEAYRHLYEEE